MKRILFAFVGLLFILSACKKDGLTNTARLLLIGTWKQVDISSKVPTGKYVKFNENGSMEGTVYPDYNAFEISKTQLVFKGSSGSISNTCTVNTDSLYIAPLDPNLCCQALFAKQQ